MAYTSIENSAEIQALKQQYAEAQAAGASKSVLNSIHQAAETLRKSAGYESTDATGEVFRETSANKAAAFPPSSVIFRIGIIMSMQDPIKVRTPKTTLSSGSRRLVTSITSAPAPNTVSPLLRSLFEKGTQNPDRKIKVQQILCCHI